MFHHLQSQSTGPGTGYSEATRLDLLIAGVDPVALDYWAAKYVLSQTATLIGYDDTSVLDPDNTEKRGLQEAFGTWLTLTKNELIRGGFNVTADESRMNVMYDYQNETYPSSSTLTSSTSDINTTETTLGFEPILSILSLTAIIALVLHHRRKRSG